MTTLVIYASRYGCTADCADYLKAHLPGDTILVDINQLSQPIAWETYDTVLIGGSVYVGKIAKKLRAFCEGNLEPLLQKKIGLFLCCAQTWQADEIFTANFPAALWQHATTRKTFGSEARLDKMSFLDRTILKAVTKGDFSNFQISKENLDAFVREIR